VKIDKIEEINYRLLENYIIQKICHKLMSKKHIQDGVIQATPYRKSNRKAYLF